MYCGTPVGVKDFLIGYDAEVEHIVPKSLVFDDSFSNKACSCRKCNHDKGNMTAFDYMKSMGELIFDDYVSRVNELKDRGIISKTKFNNLMRGADNLPEDFIERQLRESQYISRLALEKLKSICRNVRATSGSVTDYLRHVWGWDQILHKLNLERRRLEGSTEIVRIEHRDSTDEKERIINWTKRLDHRHHAIDALTIACTTQALIQRLNNLSSLAGKNFSNFHKLDDDQKQKHTMLERYALSMPHFTTAQVADSVKRILVSFKPVTKLTTPGKRYVKRGGKRIVAQTGLSVPRGKLHDETIYGKILVPDNKGGFRKEVVVKYDLKSIKSLKDAGSIVDNAIRDLVIERLKEHNGNSNEAFAYPLYSDKEQTKEIKSVRCFTGLSKTIPVKYDSNGSEIGYANPGSNYHIAIYMDADGKIHEHVATFYHCVERRRHNIPAIIHEPSSVWDDILSRNEDLDEKFLELLPKPDWRMLFTMQRNEMFIIGMDEDDYRLAMESGDKATLAEYLYKVQRLATKQYYFIKHTETDISQMQKLANKPGGRFIRIKSLNSLAELNLHKVKINYLGEIEELC